MVLKPKTLDSLDSLKSAEVIDDLDRIYETIERSLKEAGAAGAAYPTIARREADGRTHVKKPSVSVFAAIAGDVDKARKIAELRQMPWEDAYAERLQRYWASDERVDGHGDIVLQNWIWTEFEDNPVLAWSHNWAGAPIGAVLEWLVQQRQDAKYSGRALQLLTLFATGEQYDWADTIYRLVRARFLRGGSVGFAPDRVIRVEDDGERAELGLGRWGVIYDKNHLLEFSPTLLGANPGALTIDEQTGQVLGDLSEAKSKGLLFEKDVELIRELLRTDLLTRGQKDRWGVIDSGVRRVARSLFPRFEFTEHKDIEQPFVCGESRTLRCGVSLASPAPVKEADGEPSVVEVLQTIADSVKRQEATLSQFVLSMNDRLTDLQTSIETALESRGDSGETPTPAEGLNGDEESVQELSAQLRGVLSKVDALSTSAKRS